MRHLRDLLPQEWSEADYGDSLTSIDRKLKTEEHLSPVYPTKDAIFAALEIPPAKVRVVIIGQDPYPTPGMAIGRAFAVPEGAEKLPASLRNILKERANDVAGEGPSHSLEKWHEQGVLLLNRILTVSGGRPLSHSSFGWQVFTERIVKIAVEHGAYGILWGNVARELEHIFRGRAVVGAHPSPLSAHRGFFGSRPFSRINAMIEDPIEW